MYINVLKKSIKYSTEILSKMRRKLMSIKLAPRAYKLGRFHPVMEIYIDTKVNIAYKHRLLAGLHEHSQYDIR